MSSAEGMSSAETTGLERTAEMKGVDGMLEAAGEQMNR